MDGLDTSPDISPNPADAAAPTKPRKKPERKRPTNEEAAALIAERDAVLAHNGRQAVELTAAWDTIARLKSQAFRVLIACGGTIAGAVVGFALGRMA